MKSNLWYTTSLTIINEAYVELRETHPALDGEELIRRISREYYPFGERRMWPYKQWLCAVADFRKSLTFYKPPVRRTEGSSNPNQQTIII